MNVFLKEQAPHAARMASLQFKQLAVASMSDQATLFLPSLDSIISILVNNYYLLSEDMYRFTPANLFSQHSEVGIVIIIGPFYR